MKKSILPYLKDKIKVPKRCNSTITVWIGNTGYELKKKDLRFSLCYDEHGNIDSYELNIQLFTKKEFVNEIKTSLNSKNKFFK